MQGVKKNRRKILGVTATVIVAVGVLIGVLWQVGVDDPAQARNCSLIVNPEDRRECYLNDESAQVLRQAVENDQPELCQDVEHIFIPHDVTSDIKKGMIGSFVRGDEVVGQCEVYVEGGYLPRGG